MIKMRKIRPFWISNWKLDPFSRLKSTGAQARPSPNPNPNIYSSDKETHFGFETVSEEEKAYKVKAVFENVAQQYDTMNDFMSAGVHRIWKDIFIHRLGPGPKTKLIDVAGGTGDIAFRFLKYSSIAPEDPNNPSPKDEFPVSDHKPQGEMETVQEAANEFGIKEDVEGRNVLVCDINGKMLDVGKNRSYKMLSPSQQSRINWLEGDAENLYQVPDNSFDAYTIAFGIRNCVHVDKVLEEAYRILRPGGRFMCLEFSHVSNSAIKWAYDQYSFQMIPVMGQIVAGDWDSYLYLVQSIRKFPTQEDFKLMIEDAGFRFVTYENLTFGVAAIHSGFKL